MSNIMFIVSFLLITYMDQVFGRDYGSLYRNSKYYAPSEQYNAPESSYSAPSKSYDSPKSYHPAPRKLYNAPEPKSSDPIELYSAPQSSYSAPSKLYNSLESSYPAPRELYSVPDSSYSAPSEPYYAPQSSYLDPFDTYYPSGILPVSKNPSESSYSEPNDSYNPPESSNSALSESYYDSESSYSAPRETYHAPESSYSTPSELYNSQESSYWTSKNAYDDGLSSLYPAPTSLYPGKYQYSSSSYFPKSDPIRAYTVFQKFNRKPFSSKGEVKYVQENAYTPLLITIQLNGLEAGTNYILRFHERGVFQRIVFRRDPRDACLDFCGARFSGVSQKGNLNYGDAEGDVGLLTSDENGNIEVTRKTTHFSLFGADSILGRSAIIFESGILPQQVDFRLPTFSEKVLMCDVIGIDARGISIGKRSVKSSSTYVEAKHQKTPYNYKKNYYSLSKQFSEQYVGHSDPEPRYALAITDTKDGATDDRTSIIVLFEQANSKAAVNITGTYIQSRQVTSQSVTINIQEGKFDEAEENPPTRCAVGGVPFPPGPIEYINGGPMVLNRGDMRDLRGTDFSYIDRTGLTLYGKNSLMGRSIIVKNSDDSTVINCANIQHYTAGNCVYDMIVNEFLRKPVPLRATRRQLRNNFQSKYRTRFPIRNRFL